MASGQQPAERPPNVTPMPGPYDSQQIEFPASSWQANLKKWGGLFAIVAGIIGTIWAAQSWFTSTMNAEAHEVEHRVNRRIDEQMDAHTSNIHDKAVSREVYDEHVSDFKEKSAEAKEERKEILQRLDLIGKETYRSPAKWERTLKKEGLK